MPEILTNTGAKLWSKDDYSELWLSVFEELTGTGGKSNIRLIDEAIGELNSKLSEYYFSYENDRLYVCKDESSGTVKVPISLIDNNGRTALSFDGATITIDSNGIVHGTTVDSAFSLTSENAIQNKVVKAKFDSVDKAVSDNTSALAVLNGTGTGSVAKIAEDAAIAEVAKVVANAPADFDTLKEMSDWISSHENDATAMNSAIQTNTTDIATLKSGKVDKVSGKGLSTNDYTTSEKTKLGSLNSTLLNKLGTTSEGKLTYDGSEVNEITDYVVDTVAEAQAAIDNGLVREGETIYVKEDSDTFTFKGSCLSTALPSSGNSINDTYYCTDLKYRMTWNGGAWYQSSLSETEYVDELASLRNECEASYNELKGDLVDIETSFFNDNGELFLSNVNINNGYYITSDSMSILSIESMSYTDAFVVYPNDTIKCQAYGYLDNVSILSEWDENDTPKSVIQKSNGQVSWFEWTNTSNQIKRVKFCYQNNKPHRLHVMRGDWYKASNTKIVEENSKELVGLTEITDLLTYENSYIHSLNLNNVSNDGSLTSELIVLKPLESVLILARGYSTNISIITLCDSNGNNKKMMAQSNGSIQKYLYTNCSLGNEYIKVSFDKNNFHRVYKKENNIPYGFSISMFESIGVIGDSFSSGALGEYGGADFYNVSWGQILGRKNGVSVTNYSKGGLTTSTWLSDTTRGLSKLLSDNAKNLYTFNLGLNDASRLAGDSSYLGSIADVSDDNYNNNPDTFYGNTSRIISNIKAHASFSKIIMFTIPTYSNVANRDLINIAIKEIANHFNVPVIDVVKNAFFTSTYFIDYMKQGHPTAVVYSAMANEYQKLIEACMSEKILYFNDYKPN